MQTNTHSHNLPITNPLQQLRAKIITYEKKRTREKIKTIYMESKIIGERESSRRELVKTCVEY